MTKLVILTGAGISAESGLATFRASDGLWCGHRVEDVATPEGFEANPSLVHEFYNQRRAQLAEIAPNAAHLALAKLAAHWPDEMLLITQNVDNLHQRAHQLIKPAEGFSLLALHGELCLARCLDTGTIIEWHDNIECDTPSPIEGANGGLRPHIVWFGEMPLFMPQIDQALRQCDHFVAIGTSGNVYPAAGFARQAALAGAHCTELNLEPSRGAHDFHETVCGPATKTVPHLVDTWLKSLIP